MRLWRRSVLPWAVFMGLVGLASPALAQDDDERENLADLREVNVVVESLAPDAEEAGLDRRAITRAVEQQLEARGVPLGSSRSAGDLYVNIETFRGSTGLYAYCVEVSLQQLVTIEGNQLRTLADVWELGSLGTVGAGNLPQVTGIVSDIVDAFIDDYLEMNEPQ
jgi:hypothetical protein